VQHNPASSTDKPLFWNINWLIRNRKSTTGLRFGR
jgi:hypothetical protein